MTNDEVIALVCDPETRLVGATIFDALARVNINKDVGGAFVTNDDEVTFTQLRAAVQEVRAERDAAIARAEAAEALAASRLEAIEESESTLRGLLIGSHFYVQGGEDGDETFLRAEDARARAAELLTIERAWSDDCVAWGVMITLGEEDAIGTAIEDADLDTIPALRAHAAKVAR